jgi:hypothetical protein
LNRTTASSATLAAVSVAWGGISVKVVCQRSMCDGFELWLSECGKLCASCYSYCSFVQHQINHQEQGIEIRLGATSSATPIAAAASASMRATSAAAAAFQPLPVPAASFSMTIGSVVVGL